MRFPKAMPVRIASMPLPARSLPSRPRIPHKDDGTIAFETDFFKRQAFLTVSG